MADYTDLPACMQEWLATLPEHLRDEAAGHYRDANDKGKAEIRAYFTQGGPAYLRAALARRREQADRN